MQPLNNAKIAVRGIEEWLAADFMEFTFEVWGTPWDKNAHPVAKAKLTGKQQWTDKAQKYAAWKEYVAREFHKYLVKVRPDIAKIVFKRMMIDKKPIPPLSMWAWMHVNAHYKNNKHPDTENVFGSIADALFENDNGLAGMFNYDVGKHKRGGVTIGVFIPKTATFIQHEHHYDGEECTEHCP